MPVDCDWKDFSTEQNAAAITLGYTEAMWDGNGTVALEDKDWAELSDEQKAAATTLGYDEDEWDDTEGKGMFTIYNNP